MMETPEVRRPSRATAPAPPRPGYRATVTLVYPEHETDARRRLAGDAREIPWAKAEPGDPVPDWLVELSPGQIAKGRVEPIHPDGKGV